MLVVSRNKELVCLFKLVSGAARRGRHPVTMFNQVDSNSTGTAKQGNARCVAHNLKTNNHEKSKRLGSQDCKEIDSRNHRKLKKYSKNFNKMFTFFLQCYRKGILTFCGSNFKVERDDSEGDGKFCFRKYDNGEYKHVNPKTKHPNILYGVITGKKAWGLWVEQYSEGITDWSFTKEEILGVFEEKGIEIPEPLMKDFNNTLERKRFKRIERDLEEWKRRK